MPSGERGCGCGKKYFCAWPGMEGEIWEGCQALKRNEKGKSPESRKFTPFFIHSSFSPWYHRESGAQANGS